MPAVQSDYGFYRAMFKDASTVRTLLAADTSTEHANVITPKSASYSIFVQRIIFNCTTDAAQTLTFQDDAGTPIVIGKSASSPGLGIEIVGDYGPLGKQLTENTNLDIIISAAGLAGQINIEAYQRLTAVVAAGSTN